MAVSEYAARHACLASVQLDSTLRAHIAERIHAIIERFSSINAKPEVSALIGVIYVLAASRNSGRTPGQLVSGIQCVDAGGQPPRAGFGAALLLQTLLQWVHGRLSESARTHNWALSTGWRPAALTVLDACSTLGHIVSFVEFLSIASAAGGRAATARGAGGGDGEATVSGSAPSLSLLHKLFGLSAVNAASSSPSSAGPSHPAFLLVSVYALLQTLSGSAREVMELLYALPSLPLVGSASSSWSVLLRRIAVKARRQAVALIGKLRLMLCLIRTIVATRLIGSGNSSSSDTAQAVSAIGATAASGMARRGSAAALSAQMDAAAAASSSAAAAASACAMCGAEPANTSQRATCGHTFCYWCLHATLLSHKQRQQQRQGQREDQAREHETDADAGAYADADSEDNWEGEDEEEEEGPECPECYQPLAVIPANTRYSRTATTAAMQTRR
jgi:hypothetical protein